MHKGRPVAPALCTTQPSIGLTRAAQLVRRLTARLIPPRPQPGDPETRIDAPGHLRLPVVDPRRSTLCTTQPSTPARVDPAVHKGRPVAPPCAPTSRRHRHASTGPCTKVDPSLHLVHQPAINRPARSAELVQRLKLPLAAELYGSRPGVTPTRPQPGDPRHPAGRDHLAEGAGRPLPVSTRRDSATCRANTPYRSNQNGELGREVKASRPAEAGSQGIAASRNGK
jgi:hypothetical protein